MKEIKQTRGIKEKGQSKVWPIVLCLLLAGGVFIFLFNVAAPNNASVIVSVTASDTQATRRYSTKSSKSCTVRIKIIKYITGLKIVPASRFFIFAFILNSSPQILF